MSTTSLGGFVNELEPSLLVLIGLVMILIPEPATSTLGVGVALLGAAWWFYEWER